MGGSGFSKAEKKPAQEEEKTSCYYVYIDRISPNTNDVRGQNEKGDVLDIVSCDKINPPEHDFKNFNIIKILLTPTEVNEMMLPLLSLEKDENGEPILLKDKKYQIDVNGLQTATPSKFGDILYEKINIDEKITAKSVDFFSNK